MPSVFRLMRYSLQAFRVSTIFLLFLLGAGSAYAAQSAPGFWQANSSTTALPPLTASQIAQFLPSTRSSFAFPAPYNTTGIRVTLPSDCPNDSNCIFYVGYSYYAAMSNSTGLNYMWILATPQKSMGGAGPTLYKLDKNTDTVSKVGPIFTDANAAHTGETMYFSHSMPNALYYVGDAMKTLNRIDVVTHKETQIFNIDSYGSGHYVFACTTSFNDQVSACVLENSSYAMTGCIVYKGGQFQYFPAMTSSGIHSCSVAPDGKYVLISEKTPTTCQACDLDGVVADLATGTQTVIDNKRGGGGHYALGYGYYSNNMNWDPNYDSVKLWNVSDLSTDGKDIWDQAWNLQCINTVCASVPSHPSWLNAVPDSVQPISKQYECDSTANAQDVPFANQVFCFYMDPSVAPANQKSLVIAPTMVNKAKTGCPGGVYGQEPKGNIDPTGHYFIWSANLDSNNNCQVFIVKIPTSQLPYPPPVLAAPQVSITNPPNDATVFGTVSAKINISADAGIANVTWDVDGQQVDSTTTAPYTYDLNTKTLSMGSHTLTATAMDVTGNKGSATNKIVVEQAPSGSNNSGGSGSLSFLPLALMGLLVTLGLIRKRSLKRSAGRSRRDDRQQGVTP